jgi:hypothetical protein
VITSADGAISTTEQITLTYVVSVTQPITDPAELAALPPGFAPEKIIGYQKIFSNGWSLIDTTKGYSETHLVHIIAYDSAGNETKSEPSPVLVIPRPEEPDEEEATEEPADGDGAYLIPANDPTPDAFVYRRAPPFINPLKRDGG